MQEYWKLTGYHYREVFMLTKVMYRIVYDFKGSITSERPTGIHNLASIFQISSKILYSQHICSLFLRNEKTLKNYKLKKLCVCICYLSFVICFSCHCLNALYTIWTQCFASFQQSNGKSTLDIYLYISTICTSCAIFDVKFCLKII